MKIYLSTSISKLTEEITQSCRVIQDTLTNSGHEVISQDFLSINQDFYMKQSEDAALNAQKMLTKMKKKADIILFEVTNQSIGIGQEISLSLTMNKPVIALYQEGSKPHILRDQGTNLLLLCSYNKENLSEVISDSVKRALSLRDTRFDFFISPEIVAHLNEVSRRSKQPKSAYVRKLIEADMGKRL